MEESLITNPTQLSQYFNTWVREVSTDYERLLTGSFFSRVRFQSQLMLYRRQTYRDCYVSLENNVSPDLTDDAKTNIRQLEAAFKELYQKVLFNNIVVAGRIQHEDIAVVATTVEDERIAALQRVASDVALACENFKKHFGHYALNAYELSEPRFSEYDCAQLATLATPLTQLRAQEVKPSMSEYFASTSGPASITHLVGIRELGKSAALKLIAAMRQELEQIENSGTLTTSVYSHDWNELVNKL